MVEASPTIRRRELGARLRALRVASGMTVEDVASRMEVSPTKISRLETASRGGGVSIADVRFLCDLYQVAPEDRQRLLTLARESKRRSWWQQYGLPDAVATYVGLEDAALSIHQYQTSLVPGLLQTEAYARAATAGIEPDWSTEQVEQLVAARMTRQRLLSTDQPPEYWAVLDESALHYLVGGAQVMHEQLQALSGVLDRRAVTLQVIPLEAGAHPGMSSSFSILHLEEVSDVVAVEGLIGSFTLQSQTDVRRYRRSFDQLRAVALSPRESRLRIETIAYQLVN